MSTSSFLAALSSKVYADRTDYATPLDLACDYDPSFIKTPALEYLAGHLVDASVHPEHRKVVSFAPQEGKTTTSAIAFPLWLLRNRPNLRVAVVSYQKELAEEQVRAARNIVQENPELFPFTIDQGQAAKDSWRVAGKRGGMTAVGINSGFTGKPADVVIVDDPHSGLEDASSPAKRRAVRNFWTGTATARFSASTIVIIVMTRWHKEDLAGWLLERNPESFEFVRVPAQADHDPAKGESDPLGREPGEYMLSARGRTTAQWEQRKRDAGSLDWQALYQGRPVAEGGELLKVDSIARFDWNTMVTRRGATCYVPPKVGDVIGMSWDMTFKGTANSDYVVGQVWLRRDAHMYLLDQVRGQWDFTQTVDQVRAFTQKWRQAVPLYIEDKANGSAVISTLRKTRPGIIPVNPRGGKEARARAITPYLEAGNILVPDTATAPFNVDELLTEAASFPQGKHDDQVDALTQAVTAMMSSEAKSTANNGLVGLG